MLSDVMKASGFEQPDRRQMIVAIVSDKTVMFFIVQKTFIELY
jgi:hypothetical protein